MRYSEGEGTPSNKDYVETAYGLTIVNLGMDDKVLDYHDTLLRVRDVCLLTGPNWLNDAILGFYFSFLQKDKYASLRRSVSFVDASVSFLVANVAEGDVAGILEPLGLQSRQIVLFSVSNNEDVEVPEGGSHWSLLVFRKGDRGEMDTFEHYDSAGAVNERAASGLVAALAPALAEAARNGHSLKDLLKSDNPSLEPLKKLYSLLSEHPLSLGITLPGMEEGKGGLPALDAEEQAAIDAPYDGDSDWYEGW